ncbi:RNA-directed DNA polymerase, eukaryota, reverse transcriptase zinc-binding domain protein [Tanacetum coccineum]
MGDLNVSLNPKDHSKGISYVNQDMAEFRDCINCIKMEDVCSSGLHYTWIKSLLNLNNRIMKKIDRVMGVQNNMECLDLDGSMFSNKIESQVAWNMITEVSYIEIKEAIFDINDNKAPGPDGFTAKFFKKAWDTVGNDVFKAVKEFFSKGKLLGELNATLITLVPKVSTPHKVSDFIPIACCNAVYKCISKIITNRIKNALDSIVNKNQSAFIPERQITDNILFTQELLKGYDCVRGPKRCSMKIDIQKAYDVVN